MFHWVYPWILVTVTQTYINMTPHQLHRAQVGYLEGRILLDEGHPEIKGQRLKDNLKWFCEEKAKFYDVLNEEEVKEFSNLVKSRLQYEANEAHKAAGRLGMICMATGTGKSKVAIDAIFSLCQKKSSAKILLVVPTSKLRDRMWRDEFSQWGLQSIWDENITKICYASLHKYNCADFDFTVLDECHNVTEKGIEGYTRGLYIMGPCMALTATPPSDYDKRMLLNRLNLSIVYYISLDEAVDLGVVAPYEVTVITMELDNVEKYVKGGNVTRPFYQTELKAYEYFSRVEQEAEESGDRSKLSKFFYTNRMRFIYTLKSKMKAAHYLLMKVIPSDKRMLIFCGSIEISEQLCLHTYHSKSGTESYNDFINLQINRLAAVESLNEGDNLPMLDMAFIEQLNSKELDLKQRIGRVIRFRVGHTGRIFILCVKGTVDEKWTKQSTSTLNPKRVRWVALADIIAGTETLNFN